MRLKIGSMTRLATRLRDCRLEHAQELYYVVLDIWTRLSLREGCVYVLIWALCVSVYTHSVVVFRTENRYPVFRPWGFWYERWFSRKCVTSSWVDKFLPNFPALFGYFGQIFTRSPYAAEFWALELLTCLFRSKYFSYLPRPNPFRVCSEVEICGLACFGSKIGSQPTQFLKRRVLGVFQTENGSRENRAWNLLFCQVYGI